ncbi:MAG TPA: hypothetical protein ENH94_09955 [Phycisphaerales bacterium]|nr:hypothetical protein [Phycisphaerales bacterium]
MTKKQYLKIDTKPSLLLGKPANLSTLICKNKPNFLNQRITATTCKRGTYNDLHPQTHKKSKPNPNPIQTQFFHYYLVRRPVGVVIFTIKRRIPQLKTKNQRLKTINPFRKTFM